jgi:hypothetical protein
VISTRANHDHEGRRASQLELFCSSDTGEYPLVSTSQAALDAGCTEVIMPKENERDVQILPDYVKTRSRSGL